MWCIQELENQRELFAKTFEMMSKVPALYAHRASHSSEGHAVLQKLWLQ